MSGGQNPNEPFSLPDFQIRLQDRKVLHPLDAGVPRRARLDLMCPAETAITNAKNLIELMPADVLLTEATNLLSEARDKVAVFIDAEIGDKMQPYQERVITEKRELDAKIEKLDAFLHGSIYPTLADMERLRLMRQYCHMRDYSSVLGERIAAFEN